MDIDTVVRALRCCGCGRSAGSDCDNCPKNTIDYPKCAISTLDVAADLIESLTAQLTESQRRAQDARNELCQKCGRYRDAHKGACDGCRWMA